MRSSGFTLVELLVVISVMSIFGVLALVNFKDFSSSSALDKAAGEIQTYLRLAQSNATSSTLCDTTSGVNWTVTFSENSVVISCPSISNYKTLTLQSGITITPAFSVVYSALKGTPALSADSNWTDGNFTITLDNDKGETKEVIFTSGGAINVD